MALQSRAVEQPALVTHDVETILDRPAAPFAQWVSYHQDLLANAEGK